MGIFQLRLDDRERPSCVKEVEVASSSPFIKTGGKFWSCLREMTACFVLLWLNETRLSWNDSLDFVKKTELPYQCCLNIMSGSLVRCTVAACILIAS